MILGYDRKIHIMGVKSFYAMVIHNIYIFFLYCYCISVYCIVQTNGKYFCKGNDDDVILKVFFLLFFILFFHTVLQQIESHQTAKKNKTSTRQRQTHIRSPIYTPLTIYYYLNRQNKNGTPYLIFNMFKCMSIAFYLMWCNYATITV